MAGWAFDHQPEKHAKDITEKIGCPTDSLEAMVRCLKDEKSAQDIVNTHTQYIVSFYVTKKYYVRGIKLFVNPAQLGHCCI